MGPPQWAPRRRAKGAVQTAAATSPTSIAGLRALPHSRTACARSLAPSRAASPFRPASGSRTRRSCTPSPTSGRRDRRVHARYRPAFPRDARDARSQRAALRHQHPRHGRPTPREVEELVARDGVYGFRHRGREPQGVLRDPQGAPAEPRAERRARAGSRASGASSRRSAPHVPFAAWDATHALDQGQSRSPTGRSSSSRPTSPPTTSRSIRCMPAASLRSAASRARAPSSRARTSAPAAGGGRTRTARNAACTIGPTPEGKSRMTALVLASRRCSRPRASTSSARRRRSSASPVLLYSIGKDFDRAAAPRAQGLLAGRSRRSRCCTSTRRGSSSDMIAFRDKTVRELRARPHRAHQRGRPRARHQSVRPPAVGLYRRDEDAALKQALDADGFDAAFGGARRDEEASRAKERVFSFRAAGHRWDPRRQRPEMWHLLNGRLGNGETVRVFPLSNWTEARRVALHRAARSSTWCRSISPPSARWSRATASFWCVDDERMRLAARREAGDAQGALPHARLLAADRRGRVRRDRHRQRRRRDARRAHVRAGRDG